MPATNSASTIQPFCCANARNVKRKPSSWFPTTPSQCSCCAFEPSPEAPAPVKTCSMRLHSYTRLLSQKVPQYRHTHTSSAEMASAQNCLVLFRFFSVGCIPGAVATVVAATKLQASPQLHPLVTYWAIVAPDTHRACWPWANSVVRVNVAPACLMVAIRGSRLDFLPTIVVYLPRLSTLVVRWCSHYHPTLSRN